MPTEETKPVYLRPERGKEYRMSELLAEIQKRKISLEGIEIENNPEVTATLSFCRRPTSWIKLN